MPNAPGSAAPIPVPATPVRFQVRDIILWVLITFLVPALYILAFRHKLAPQNGLLTLHAEIPGRFVQAFFVALATYVVSRLEKRPLLTYGMPPRQAFGARFWEGCAWGFVMMSLILLVIRLTGHFQIDSVALSGRAVFKYAVGWALVFYFVAISEEFIFRGYILFLYTQRMRFWRGALVLSVLFGVAHLGNPGENVFGIVQVIVVGLIFCFTIRRTGTLWLAVGFHASWDWAQTFFYGTADSGLFGVGRFLNTSSAGPRWLTGGSAGPEGSVVALIVLLLFALLVHLRFPNAIYPDRAQ